MSRVTDQAADLARLIATPALMGQHLGRRLLGSPYKVYPWIQHLERKVLSEIVSPGRKIIIVSVPPQNGKTTYFGLLLPMWYLGMNPGHQVIFVSYNETQASKWGLKTRNAMNQFGPELFGESVDSSADSKLDWKLTNGFGGMMSAGIGGGITGNPGHLIICDDLLKGDEDAGSATIKQGIFDEIQGSVFSRFQNNTKMFVIATRWAEDDPSGRLIEMASQSGYRGRPVEIINIKAIAEPSYEEREEMRATVLDRLDLDPELPIEEREEIVRRAIDDEIGNWRDFLGRGDGEALEGQFDQDFYEEVRATVESHSWFSLYQGEPTLREGGMFPIERWKYYTPEQLPEMVRRVRVWDLASSEGKGDWTVGTLMGKGSNGLYYILERERFREGPDGVERHVLDAAKRDGQEVPIQIEQERSGTGITVLDSYKRKLIGWNVEPAKAEGSKESRATPYSNAQRVGAIYLPADAHWLKEWRDEHVQMDGAGKMPRHDDQIDTGAYAFKFLTEGGVSEFWDPSQLVAHARSLGDSEAEMEAFAVERLLTG